MQLHTQLSSYFASSPARRYAQLQSNRYACPMRLATWNVNSIRARIDRVIAFLERSDTDVLAMQEIKCRPDQFPTEAFTQAGYEVVAHGLNQWNGVAIASRIGLSDVVHQFPDQPTWAAKAGEDGVVEARALAATCAGVRVWSIYAPNGRELDHPHYRYKLDWFAALRQDVAESLAQAPEQKTIFVGDWNVAPLDTDVWDIAAWEGKTHVSAPERAAFASLERAGLVEITRPLTQGYTYWDYKGLAFPKNKGMRIDFMLASPALAQLATNVVIDRDERKGKGASDHVPVIVDFDLDTN